MAGLTRLPDWEERLATLLAACRSRPYEMGAWDCAQFAGAAVEAVAGVNPAAEFRGRYRTRAEGLRLLPGRRDRLRGTLIRLFGPPVSPLLLRRGDIARRDTAIGVVWACGALFVGADGEREGLVSVGLAEIAEGWRVGE